MRILERVAAVQMTEPALLAGETGTGKTAPCSSSRASRARR